MKKTNHRRQQSQTSQRDAQQKGPLYPRHLRAVIGDHAIFESLKCRLNDVEMLWLEEGWESSHDLKTLHQNFQKKISNIQVKPRSILDRLGGSHQGAALFLNSTPQIDWDHLKNKKTSVVLLLDGVEDPHNLGAILRTSWLMNVDAILIPQDRSVGLTPTVHKVACGGAEHVPIQVCNQFSNILEDLKKMGYWIYGLGHSSQNSIFSLKLPEKVVWCLGSEDKGLRSTTERLCDDIVRIPQASAAASYNVSVAVGMAVIETFRQQQLSPR